MTAKGARLVSEVEAKLGGSSSVSPTGLSFGKPAFALVVKGKASAVDSGVSEFQEAVKAGADGMTMASVVGGSLKLAGSRYAVSRKDEDSLKRKLAFGDGDVVVVCFAGEAAGAERGAWAVACKLLNAPLVK